MTAPSTLTLTLASKNAGKKMELLHYLAGSSLPIEIALNEQAGDVDETGRDFIENALLKAQSTPPVTGSQLVLGEDSGLVVDALDGSYGISPFPGLYSNRWLTPAIRDELLDQSHPNRMPLERTNEQGITNSDLCQGILKLMAGQTNRTARYCCGMVLWHSGSGLLFQTLQSTELKVLEGEARGENGFGYDPIMILPNETRTMAEIDTARKNSISHRGKAFRQLLDFLARNGWLKG